MATEGIQERVRQQSPGNEFPATSLDCRRDQRALFNEQRRGVGDPRNHFCDEDRLWQQRSEY
jgi:hypothetical protein